MCYINYDSPKYLPHPSVRTAYENDCESKTQRTGGADAIATVSGGVAALRTKWAVDGGVCIQSTLCKRRKVFFLHSVYENYGALNDVARVHTMCCKQLQHV
jgi:hypothetical protein